MKSTAAGQTRSLHEDLRDQLTISTGKLLAYLYIVQIILKITAVQIAQILWDQQFPIIPVQLLQRLLDLLPTASCLVLGDQRVFLDEILLFALVQIDGQVLIMLRHLLAQISAAGVDHQIVGTVRCPVHLDEMVTATQSPQATLQSFGISQRPVAAQLLQIKALSPSLPDIHPRRNIVSRRIQLFQVDGPWADIYGVHAATNIYANHIGNCLVDDRHGGTDGASFTSVDIGHDANLAASGKLLIAHPADLLDSLIFYNSGIAGGCGNLSFDLEHVPSPFF